MKPCPFCGSERVAVIGSMMAYVRCGECGCLGPNIFPKGDEPVDSDYKKAEEKWNERH